MQVEIAGWISGSNYRVQAVDATCRSILLPVIGKNIVVRNGYGKSLSPASDSNAFELILQSDPAPAFVESDSGPLASRAPLPLFDLPAASEAPLLPYSGKGLALLDEQGNIAGELIGETFYLFFDVGVTNSMLDTIRFARVMRKLAEIYYERSQSGTGGTDQLPRFAALCTALVAPTVAGSEPSPEREERQTRFRERMLACLREEQILLRNESRPQEMLAEEFDRLMELASVVNVVVVPGWLTVETSVLFCRDPRTDILHEIGAFDIHIPTEAGDIRWYNRDRKVHAHSADMQAPHVFKDGSACLGNVKDLFPKLIARRDFSTAVQVAIAFIESVNVDDQAGQFVNCWPIADQSLNNKHSNLCKII